MTKRSFDESFTASSDNTTSTHTSAIGSTNNESKMIFQSKIFNIQSEELINEATLNKKRKQKADNFLKSLRDAILEIDNGVRRKVNDRDWLLEQDVQWPLPADINFASKDSDLQFTYMAPTEVKVIGSYTLGTSVRPRMQADLLVEMPKGSIEPKDYLNQCYLYKRALYLCHIAGELRSNYGELIDVNATYFTRAHNDPCKPLLEVTPKGGLAGHFCVHIHTTPQAHIWPSTRFASKQSNVRDAWFFDNNTSASLAPTPLYNSMIGRDLSFTSDLMFMHSALKKGECIKNCVRLLKVWLTQRQFDKRIGGFDGYHLTMYIAKLHHDGKITSSMGLQKCINVILVNLANEKWPSYFEKWAENEATVHYGKDVCHDEFDLVSREAKLALDCMSLSNCGSSFNKIFMVNIADHLNFDQVLILDLVNKSSIRRAFNFIGQSHDLVDTCNQPLATILPRLRSLLKHALGDRIIGPPSLFYNMKSSSKWLVNEKPSTYSSTHLYIGLHYNHQTCFNSLDKGPAAGVDEQSRANVCKFTEFWGEKCELRRFKDGSICEAVLWSESQNLCDRRNVPATIVDYVCKRHLGLRLVKQNNDAMDILRLPKHIVDEAQGEYKDYGTGENGQAMVIQTAEVLCKNLRSLSKDELPLTIVGIHLLHPSCRATDAFPVLSCTYANFVNTEDNIKYPKMNHPSPMYLPSMQIICMLESSGKWPEDIEAVQRIKSAFLIQLATVLQDKYKLVIKQSVDCLQVYSNGFVFKLKIGYKREIVLHKMYKESEDAALKMLDNDTSLKLQYTLVDLPKIMSAINGVHQANLSSFNSAVRLCKRWLAGHLLLDDDYMFPELTVELMVCSLYVDPLPFTTPSTPHIAFIRFLNMLSTFDFQTKPLIVNFNNELQVAESTNIENTFKREKRVNLPSIVLLTPYNYTNTLSWKKQISPPTVVLNFCRNLARQISSSYLSVQSNKMLFTPPMESFDVVISLYSRHLCRSYQNTHPRSEAQLPCLHRGRDHKVFPVVHYEPARILLQSFRDAFGNIALFFHDIYGGNDIAVLWKPNYFKKASMNNHNTIGFDITELDLKKQIILEDFAIMGKGIIKNISVK